MIKITDIRCAMFAKQWPELRAMHDRAKIGEDIEGCNTEEKKITIQLAMIENSLMQGKSPGHTRQLDAMLDAIERGNHPYDDKTTMATIESDAAIAKAQIDAWLDQPRKP
jgi:hypothetical protein